MRLIAIALFAASLALAQTPGTFTHSTTNNETATAGTLVCTISNSTPVLPTGVRVVCTNNGEQVASTDAVVPVGANGLVGSLLLGGNAVTWMVTQPVAGPYLWEMVANGARKTGAF